MSKQVLNYSGKLYVQLFQKSRAWPWIVHRSSDINEIHPLQSRCWPNYFYRIYILYSKWLHPTECSLLDSTTWPAGGQLYCRCQEAHLRYTSLSPPLTNDWCWRSIPLEWWKHSQWLKAEHTYIIINNYMHHIKTWSCLLFHLLWLNWLNYSNVVMEMPDSWTREASFCNLSFGSTPPQRALLSMLRSTPIGTGQDSTVVIPTWKIY